MTETDFNRTERAVGSTTEGAGDGGTVRQQASEIASATTQEAQNVAATAKQEASAVASDIGTQARRVAGEATTQLKRQGDDQLHRLAGTIGDVSQELRRMGEAGGESTAAGMVSEAAGLLDRLGGRLIEGGVDGAVSDLKRFARNRPAVFLAAAAGVGFVAGRFVRNVDRSALTGSDGDSTPSLTARPAALDAGPAPSSTGFPGTTGAAPGATGLAAGPTTTVPHTNPGTMPQAGSV